MENITAYPLCWPTSKGRSKERKYGRFSTKRTNSQGWKCSDDITIAQALERIKSELEIMDGPGGDWQRIDPDSIVISTNLKVRKSDGMPASNQSEPIDPGAVLYFIIDGNNQCIAVDSYTKVSQNLAAIAAIAAVISALRSLDRHGSGLMEAAFTGFTALPGPDYVVSRSWRDVINYYGENIKEAEKAYRQARKIAHPDHGGSSDQFNVVELSWYQAKIELKG